MDLLFQDFARAQSTNDGYALSRTISPDLPLADLWAIWNSCNTHDVKAVLKRGIQKSTSGIDRLPHDEVQGWVEVYASYWKALGELLAVQEASSSNGKVCCGGWDPLSNHS